MNPPKHQGHIHWPQILKCCVHRAQYELTQKLGHDNHPVWVLKNKTILLKGKHVVETLPTEVRDQSSVEGLGANVVSFLTQ